MDVSWQQVFVWRLSTPATLRPPVSAGLMSPPWVLAEGSWGGILGAEATAAALRWCLDLDLDLESCLGLLVLFSSLWMLLLITLLSLDLPSSGVTGLLAEEALVAATSTAAVTNIVCCTLLVSS